MPPAPAPGVEPVKATRRFWQDLGLPGLFDVHVHFLPDNVQRKVWAQFDQAGPKIGREWPIRYRSSQHERVALLRDFGVCRFSALPYAHRPGIATYPTAGLARSPAECRRRCGRRRSTQSPRHRRTWRSCSTTGSRSSRCTCR